MLSYHFFYTKNKTLEVTTFVNELCSDAKDSFQVQRRPEVVVNMNLCSSFAED